jgi:hypothetical protein
MTTFQQALHIFRKDVRHLRIEIAAIFVLLVIFMLSGVQTWEALQERGGPISDEGPMIVLLPLAWSLLIVRAIQTEALPGDRHFWLTRPYSRMGLVLSKLLLILAFVNVPFLIAQAIVIAGDGMPVFSSLGGLLWNQVILSVMVLLPVSAVAALTRNLAQFVPAALLAGALFAFPIGARRFLGDMEWIRTLLGFGLAASLAAFVLWRQYRLRRSANTALLALGAVVASAVVYIAFPRSAAFAIQSNVVGSRDGQFALRLAEATPRPPSTVTLNRYSQPIALPVAISGATPEELRVESSSLVFRTLSGITRHESARVAKAEQRLMLTTALDRRFFDAAKDSPVTVSGEFYLTQFGNTRSADVPLDGTPVYIDGPGQCGVAASYDQRRFVCRSTFRSPRTFVAENIEVAHDRYDRWEDAYSPFPTYFHIYPVVARTYEIVGPGRTKIAPAAPERPAKVIVRDPIAYFRYEMEAPNVKLGPYAISNPQEENEF